MRDLLVRAATLIDGTGRDPVTDVVIRVAGDRIADVDDGSAGTGRQVETVDLGELTVLPGLIDLHTHMGITNLVDQDAVAPAITAALLFRNAELCLMSGHTTAREVAGADGGLKAAIDQGLVTGPRLYPSGPLLCQTGGHGHFGPVYRDHDHGIQRVGMPGLAQVSEVCDGPDQVRLAVRNAFRRGATQIKVCVSGGVVSLTDDISHTQFSVEELKVAVEEAAARGTYVTAHAHNSRSINNGLDAGLECFEHGSFLDEQTAARMAAAGAALVPTMTVAEVMLDDPQGWGLSPAVVARADGLLDAMAESLRVAHDAGVTIGSGTDLIGPEQNRRGRELALKAGVIGPMAALESATRVNAGILRAGDHLGTVEAGKYADLIAVDGDPLAEPELFDDPDRVIVVCKGGQLVKDLR